MEGHPELNTYLLWITYCHEAGHAVAAYHLRFPTKDMLVNRPTHGIVEMAHVERNAEAVKRQKLKLTSLKKCSATGLYLFDSQRKDGK